MKVKTYDLPVFDVLLAFFDGERIREQINDRHIVGNIGVIGQIFLQNEATVVTADYFSDCRLTHCKLRYFFAIKKENKIGTMND